MQTPAAAQSSSRRITRRLGTAIAVAAAFLTLSAPAGAATAAGGDWPWPLSGEVVTPYTNGSDPYAAGQHRGLDIAAPDGSPVRAIVDGRVTFSSKLPDGGQTVTVRSADGRYLVSFLHLASRAVARGDSVEAGALIGTVGTTGKRSVEQPHLHLGVRLASNRSYLDPATLLAADHHVVQPVDGGEPSAGSEAAPVTKPAQKVERSGRIPIEPLELAPQTVAHRAATKAHAQNTGGSVPAVAGRANANTPRASGAGTNAREGRAAEASRAAPPPLRETSTPAAVPVIAKTANAPVARIASDPAKASSSGQKRVLLLLIAFVCLAALILRRHPTPATADTGPAAPNVEDAPPVKAAEVIPIRRTG